MRKSIVFIVAAIALSVAFTACNKKKSNVNGNGTADSTQVLTDSASVNMGDTILVGKHLKGAVAEDEIFLYRLAYKNDSSLVAINFAQPSIGRGDVISIEVNTDRPDWSRNNVVNGVNKRLFTMTYENLLTTIATTLRIAQNRFDFQNLKQLNISMLCCGDLDLDVTQAYMAQANDDPTPVIMKSRLINDIKNILKPYNLDITSVSSDYQMIESKRLRVNSTISEGRKVPAEVLDAIVHFQLGPIK